MARGNRKGPDERGVMSGRGAGYCAGNSRPGYANPDMPPIDRPIGGRNRAFGRGGRSGARGDGLNRWGGFGFRNRWWPRRNTNENTEGERKGLLSRLAELQNEFDGINSRIKNLNSTTNEEEIGDEE